MRFASLASPMMAPILTLLVSIPATATAQEQPGLEEIVVTVRKVAESLQDAPVSVAAFTETALEERSIANVRDVAAYAPNVSAPVGYSGGDDGFYYIRGVGQNDFSTAFDPGVGSYIDGVYLGRTAGAMFELMDIERIEILRGPQGTLFGRNTIGGAINVVSSRPGAEFGGRVTVLGGERDRFEGRVSVSGPLVENVLSGKFTALAKQQDGYGTNRLYDETLGDIDLRAARLQFDWTPADQVDVLLSVDYSDNDGTARPQTTTGHLVGIDPALLPFMIPLPQDINDFANPSEFDNWASVEPINELEVWGASLTITWDAGPATVKSITAYRELEQFTTADYDASPYVFYDDHIPLDQDQFSQELQLTGSAVNDRLDWLLGAYYYEESVDQTNGITLGGTGPLGFIGFSDPYTDLFGRFYPGGIPLYDPLTRANLSQQGQIINNQNILLDVESWALFGQFSFALTERLSLTLGVRYTDEKKKQDYRFIQDNTIPGLRIPIDPFGFVPEIPDYIPRAVGQTLALATSVSESWSEITPRLGLEYRFTDALMGYLSYSEGFRSGGFNSRPILPSIDAFDPETLQTYELGIKSEWFDRRLRANFAAFYSDYEDIQLGVIENGFFNVKNAGKAEVKGFELEIVAVPLEGLELNLGVGYLDNEIKEVDPTAMIAGIVPGNSLPFTPEWTLNLGGRYRWSLGNAGSLTLRADYNFTDEQYSFANNWAGNRLPSAGVVNLRAWWETPDAAWQVAVYGTNIFDESYLNFAEDVLFVLGTITQWPAAPSEWGVEVTYRF